MGDTITFSETCSNYAHCPDLKKFNLKSMQDYSQLVQMILKHFEMLWPNYA